MIIGLYSPTPGSGKSEVARIFERYGFERLSFATPVKESLAVVLSGLGVADYKEYLWGEKKEHVIPELGVTGGYLMSTYATKFFRDTINQDVWLNILKKRAAELHDECKHIVIDDMRFPNEFAWLYGMTQNHSMFQGHTIKVVRPSAKGNSHTRVKGSEGLLDDRAFRHTIVNDGTIEDLVAEIGDLIDYIEHDYF